MHFNHTHKESMNRAYNQDVEIGMNLLDCITDGEDRKKAKTHFESAVSDKAKPSDILYSQGLAYLKLGKEREANNIFDALVDRDAIKDRWDGSGNHYTGNARPDTNPDPTVFYPPYGYCLNHVNTPELAESLRRRLEVSAGQIT